MILDYFAIIIATVSVIIAAFSVFFSIHSWKKSYKTLHRPYVWVGNFAYINNMKQMIPVPSISIIKIFKSPAKILREQYSFFIEGENITETIREETLKGDTKYPTEYGDIQYKYEVPDLEKYFNDEKYKHILYRYIKIDYKWIPSDDKTTYYFEGKWKYNPLKHDWDVIYINAN